MLRLATLLLLVPTVIWGADPFTGTWKLNASKSKFDKGTPPKDQVVTITEAGGNLDTSVTNTPANGNAISYRYTVPAQGGTGEVSLQRDASGSNLVGEVKVRQTVVMPGFRSTADLFRRLGAVLKAGLILGSESALVEFPVGLFQFR
jgi:hypothetical protein